MYCTLTDKVQYSSCQTEVAWINPDLCMTFRYFGVSAVPPPPPPSPPPVNYMKSQSDIN